MSSILFSPHNDDESLFCSYICMQEKPLVVIVMDSYLQPARGRGWEDCTAENRWKETKEACHILDVPVISLGLRDDTVTEEQIVEAMKRFSGFNKVYAPAIQDDGNVHHNMVARAAQKVFDQVIKYATYTSTNLSPLGYYEKGDYPIVGSSWQVPIKERALECYQSQLRVNGPHFDAVIGKDEWILK